MIKEYILKNYKYGDPIFIYDLPCKSKGYLRQELKKLVDNKELARYKNGIYYLPYKTILGDEGSISYRKFLDGKYLKDGAEGIYTGISLMNLYGFTTQMPAVLEIKSNKATTNQRKLKFEKFKYIVYSSNVKITKDNYRVLELLEVLSLLEKYPELNESETKFFLKRMIDMNNINLNIVKKYLDFYPDVVYKNIYKGGLMGELLWWVQRRFLFINS